MGATISRKAALGTKSVWLVTSGESLLAFFVVFVTAHVASLLLVVQVVAAAAIRVAFAVAVAVADAAESVPLL